MRRADLLQQLRAVPCDKSERASDRIDRLGVCPRGFPIVAIDLSPEALIL